MFRSVGVLAAVMVMSGAGAANAATSVTFDESNIGIAFTINFNGQTSPSTIFSDLTAVARIQLVSIDEVAHTFNFAYTLDNTSAVTSRVAVFAFDVTTPTGTPVVTGYSGNTVFSRVGSGQLASIGSREVCFRGGGNANNCAGGGGGGVAATGGFTSAQLFKLSVPSSSLTVTLANFGIKYQGISGGGNPSSAEGIGTVYDDAAVPEPATWMTMIAGFGLIGAAARRRRVVAA